MKAPFIIRLLILTLLLAPRLVFGQIQLSKDQKLKVRFVEHALLTMAGETFSMLDAHSTREIQAIGGRENNPLLRPFVHSNGLYAEQTIEQAGLAWLGWKMHRSHNRFLRATWWAPQAAQITFNIRGWRGNVRGLDQHGCWLRYGRLNCFH